MLLRVIIIIIINNKQWSVLWNTLKKQSLKSPLGACILLGKEWGDQLLACHQSRGGKALSWSFQTLIINFPSEFILPDLSVREVSLASFQLS